MEFGGVWWSLVEFGGVWWSLVEFGGVWWSEVEFGGVWWSLVELVELVEFGGLFEINWGPTRGVHKGGPQGGSTCL